MGLQIGRPMLDSFYDGNVHYKMEAVICRQRIKVKVLLQHSTCYIIHTRENACRKIDSDPLHRIIVSYVERVESDGKLKKLEVDAIWVVCYDEFFYQSQRA